MTLYFFDDESQNNYELGSHFLSGEELEQSDEKAFHYLKLAADAGHDQAQNEIGLMYVQGIGTKKDNRKAFYYFNKSAENENIDGAFK